MDELKVYLLPTVESSKGSIDSGIEKLLHIHNFHTSEAEVNIVL